VPGKTEPKIEEIKERWRKCTQELFNATTVIKPSRMSLAGHVNML